MTVSWLELFFGVLLGMLAVDATIAFVKWVWKRASRRPIEERIVSLLRSRGGEMRGFDVWQAIGGPVGSVHAALDRLDRAGVVDRRTGEPNPARGGRPDIYYRVEP